MGIDLCFIHAFFGIPCPGCGMTRAWLSFLSFDFKAAFYYHPLFWLVPIIFIVVLFRKRSKICYDLYRSKYFFTGCIIAFIGVYIIRCILLFPHTAPMDFNNQAILVKIISYVRNIV